MLVAIVPAIPDVIAQLVILEELMVGIVAIAYRIMLGESR